MQTGEAMDAAEAAAGRLDLDGLVAHRESVQIGQGCAEVYEAFSQHEHEYVAVLEGRRIVGLCSRSKLGFLLGSRFGFSLYSRKPIRDHLIDEFVSVRNKNDLISVMASVLSRSGQEFHHDVVLTKEDGSFLGIITTRTPGCNRFAQSTQRRADPRTRSGDGKRTSQVAIFGQNES